MAQDTPSTAMQKALALFDAPSPEDRDLEWFLDFLAVRGWTTAEVVLRHVGKEPTEDAKRWVRSLAERSEGRVIGQSKGYRLTKHLTTEEYKQWRAASLRSVKSVQERVMKTDQVFGYQNETE